MVVQNSEQVQKEKELKGGGGGGGARTQERLKRLSNGSATGTAAKKSLQKWIHVSVQAS